MNERLKAAAAKLLLTEDCFYLYDEAGIRSRARALTRSFPSAKILYSLKANPFFPVARVMKEEGFGADAASAAEVRLAVSLGMMKEEIQYSAPGSVQRTSGRRWSSRRLSLTARARLRGSKKRLRKRGSMFRSASAFILPSVLQEAGASRRSSESMRKRRLPS